MTSSSGLYVDVSMLSFIHVYIICWLTIGCALEDDRLFNCLEGRAYCERDPTCVKMLQNLPHVCREEVFYSCDSSEQNQCQAVQNWLKTVPGLQHCHCYVSNLYLELCLQIQTSVFDNRCVKGQGPLPRPPHFNEATRESDELHSRESGELLPREEREEGFNYDDSADELGDEHYYDYDDDEEEDMYYGKDTPISCIGVRKHCLQDKQCAHHLNEYRRLCKENKKKGECVAVQVEECYETIEALHSSGLFQCQCHMKRPRTRERCDRMQDRIANNTCLVTVPYLYHSTKTLATSYDDLVSLVSSSVLQTTPDPAQMEYFHSWQLQHGISSESTCVVAFNECNTDTRCRMGMAEFMAQCVWNRQRSSTPRCDREVCLGAIRRFYLLVRPEKSHALLFCRCEPGDYKCEAVRQGLYPMCSTVDTPPPTCHDILQQCQEDGDCKKRWQSYEDYCHYDKIMGGCRAGTAMCRNAQVGIMGTVLTTNCTCPSSEDEHSHRLCLDARRRLQHNNVCKELAIEDYNAPHTTTPYGAHLWKGALVQPEQIQDCKNNLGYRIPKYMPLPRVIRLYRNESECSDLCQCERNGSISCKRLECPPPHSCKEKQHIYAHGTGFVRPESGECRCIKGEIVCAKPQGIRVQQQQGIFIYIGFSISERYLLEAQSVVKFDVYEISEKVAALLNAESEEQLCRLTLYHQENGNILFEVKLSRHSMDEQLQEVCEKPAKSLVYMISTRHPAIVTDAQLSILKVAEVESTPAREMYSSANEQQGGGVSKSHVRSLQNDDEHMHNSASRLYNIVTTNYFILLMRYLVIIFLSSSCDVTVYFCWR